AWVSDYFLNGKAGSRSRNPKHDARRIAADSVEEKKIESVYRKFVTFGRLMCYIEAMLAPFLLRGYLCL
ncbi:MAG: hypothetical protein ACHQM6_01505, partial [Candidatus Kapaibacterium sp.]